MQMSETDAYNERTVLDYLNEDCWRAVLQYVPVWDLIRTEPASRLWQSLVLTYLRGARISVVDRHERPKKTHSNACTLKLMDYKKFESFAMWTSKVGSSVVGAYCNSLEDLKVIHDNCPNLEILMFTERDECGSSDMLPYNLNKDFKHLQGLYFYSSSVSDKWLKQFIADKALEELAICDDCYHVKGDFFNTINLSNLKSLALGSSDCLDSEHLLAAVDRLTELTKLVLTEIPFETSEAIQHALDKMSKLEHLELCDDWLDCYDYEPLSRLSHLKFLRSSFRVPDEGFEMILEGCKELTTLELLDCRCLSGSLVSDILCRYGTQLHTLKLEIFHCMEDDDLVSIIRGCPALTSLTITAADLSPALPARAAAARSAARPGVRLLLDLSDTILVEPEQLKGEYGEYEPMQTEFEDLSIKLSEDEN